MNRWRVLESNALCLPAFLPSCLLRFVSSCSSQKHKADCRARRCAAMSDPILVCPIRCVCPQSGSSAELEARMSRRASGEGGEKRQSKKNRPRGPIFYDSEKGINPQIINKMNLAARFGSGGAPPNLPQADKGGGAKGGESVTEFRRRRCTSLGSSRCGTRRR